jgi:hypothetical protein
MYEIILTVCVFANSYSTDLVCEKQRLDELPSCAAVVIEQKPEVMIKGVECRKMVPVAPPTEEGQENA